VHARFAQQALAFLLLTQALQAQAGEPRPDPRYRELKDELGRAVRVPQPVRRIVSLAPSLTETVYALGLEDRLVGDTDYCDFPAAAQQKPKVGGAINPSLETIASLRPDLVLVTKNFNRLETVQALADLGFASYATDPQTVDEIISGTARLADILGAANAGSVLAQELQQRLAETKRKVSSLPARRVLFVVWRDPLISVGKNTFIANSLEQAGAVSVVESSQNWPQVNLEEVVRLQPEYLVFAESQWDKSTRELDVLKSLPGWRILDAVRNRRYAVVSDAVNRPGPRIITAIEDLARQLHPEAFATKPESRRKELNPVIEVSKFAQEYACAL
jgi:iron complex transport system substrate-binding protein